MQIAIDDLDIFFESRNFFKITYHKMAEMNDIDQFFHVIRTKNTELVEALLPLHLHSRSHDGSMPCLQIK